MDGVLERPREVSEVVRQPGPEAADVLDVVNRAILALRQRQPAVRPIRELQKAHSAAQKEAIDNWLGYG